MAAHRRLKRHTYRETVLSTAASGVLLGGTVLALAPGAQAGEASHSAKPATSVSAPQKTQDWGTEDCDDGDADWCDGYGYGDGDDDGGWYYGDEGQGRHRGAHNSHDHHRKHHKNHGRHRKQGPGEHVSGNKAMYQEMAREMIHNDAQFSCFSHIIKRESDWNPRAGNRRGAYGLPQALPGRKMASAGADWRTNPRTQIRWAIHYMDERYGSPCAAWAHWRNHHNY
jgi:hypothetical protein